MAEEQNEHPHEVRLNEILYPEGRGEHSTTAVPEKIQEKFERFIKSSMGFRTFDKTRLFRAYDFTHGDKYTTKREYYGYSDQQDMFYLRSQLVKDKTRYRDVITITHAFEGNFPQSPRFTPEANQTEELIIAHNHFTKEDEPEISLKLLDTENPTFNFVSFSFSKGVPLITLDLSSTIQFKRDSKTQELTVDEKMLQRIQQANTQLRDKELVIQIKKDGKVQDRLSFPAQVDIQEVQASLIPDELNWNILQASTQEDTWRTKSLSRVIGFTWQRLAPRPRRERIIQQASQDLGE